MTLGGRFKLIRNIFNLKVDDFASLLQTKKAYIYNVIRDERGISESTAQKLFETYGVSPEWLKNGSGRIFATWDKALPFLLKKNSFMIINEILLIFEAIHFTYCMGQERNVSTEFVKRLFAISSYLLEKIDATEKEGLADVLPSLLGRDLDERLLKLQAVAGNDQLTRGEIGRYISNLIISLLEKTNEMSQEEIQELSSMMAPWSFWIARQATSQTFVRVDTSIVEKYSKDSYLTPGRVHIKKGIATFDYDSSWIHEKSVVLTFSDTLRVTLTTNVLSLYELVYCLDNLSLDGTQQTRTCETKNWCILADNASYIVTFSQSTAIALTTNQFNDLMDLGVEIKKNKPLYYLIVSRYLEEYGTI